MSKKIRLSQCMIVKNEEKNIRRALEWAKEIAFEQIVVDTGSTDRTVEIAKEMGAKVYYFEWCNDFAAAKNYAIDQAKGDWIAFLDADEYLNVDDAKKVLPYIKKYCQNDLLRCAWVQLNQEGKIFAISVQDRFFRNHPSIRYHGKIHENIKKLGNHHLTGVDLTKEISIFHTGYTQEVYESTNKLERNIALLEKEVEKNPDNYEIWSYLGESLYVAKRLKEADECLKKALQGKPGKNISNNRYESAQTNYLRSCIDQSKSEEEVLERAKMAGYPENCAQNIIFFMGLYYLNRGENLKAFQEFETYMARTQQDNKQIQNINSFGNIEKVCIWLTELSRRLQMPQKVVYYGVLALRSNLYLDGVLSAVLECFMKDKSEKETSQGTCGFLQKLYNFNNKKDAYFVYKCAKIVGFYALEDRLMKHFTEEEQKELQFGIEKKYIELENIPPINETNKMFLKWVEEYQNQGIRELRKHILTKLEKLKKTNIKLYRMYEEYHNKYQFWGTLGLEKDNDSIDKRCVLIKEHLQDFIWLYKKLSDYRSKRTLLAILQNWTSFDFNLLNQVKINEKCYFDFDLIPSAEEEIFVDLGAFVGDTIIDFVSSYDKSYRKIYAYECSKENIEKLERAIMRYERVQICPKAVGKEIGSFFMKQGVEASSNRITDEDADPQEKGYMVPVVSLDEDIKEPVSWIKMDIEGAEYDALLGAREHIIKDKPKLSISVYHGYDDLWRIPRLIHEMNPEYDFYLRHYGGNLIPTEYVLTAIPKNNQK